MTDVTDLLAEWRDLADEASSGPWDYYRPHPRYRSYVIERVTPAGHLSDDGVVMVCEDVNAEGNAAFVASSRTAVPALLDAVQAALDLHRPDVVAVSKAECCECGCCGCEGGCSTRPLTICRGCLAPAEEADPYITEEGGISAFTWPCPIVRAISDALTTGDTND